MAFISSVRTGAAANPSCSITVGRSAPMIGMLRCCSSSSMDTVSWPSIAAGTDARARCGAVYMDYYAADAAAVVEYLDLRDAIHIGHSTGGGVVARYVAQYGKGRVAKASPDIRRTASDGQNAEQP